MKPVVTLGTADAQSVVLSLEQIGLEKIMTRSARIGLAAVLLLRGGTFAIAQNGSATGGYPPGSKNSSPHGYYGHYRYSDRYAQRPYAPYYSYYCRTPYYVLGYPVPHYGYMGWCGWRY
jgi:hypothetical protein